MEKNKDFNPSSSEDFVINNPYNGLLEDDYSDLFTKLLNTQYGQSRGFRKPTNKLQWTKEQYDKIRRKRKIAKKSRRINQMKAKGKC